MCSARLQKRLCAPLEAGTRPQKAVLLSDTSMVPNVSPVFMTFPLHLHDGAHELYAQKSPRITISPIAQGSVATVLPKNP